MEGMRRGRGSAFLLLALLPFLADSADAQRRDGRSRSVGFENLTFESKQFQSKAMQRSWDYGIFLPKDYAKDKTKTKTYPWIIHLHGMNENHQRFSYRGGAEVVDELMGKKQLPELILVCAEGGRTSFFLNGRFTARFEDMVVKDLVAHIEKTYRVKKGREHRALLGQSAGGGAALRIGLTHPEVFAAVATHSAAILPKDPDRLKEEFPWINSRGGRDLVVAMFGHPVDQNLWRKSNPLWLAQKLEPDDLSGLKIYFDCGTRDRYGFHEPNLAFHKLLQKRKIQHEWRSVEGGRHGNDYNADQLPHSLAFIAAAWSQRQGLKGLGGLMGGSKGNGDKPIK